MFLKEKILFTVFVGITLFSALVFVSPVSAKKTIADAEAILQRQVAPQTGISTTELSSHTGTLIQGALRLVGIAFLVLMVYGGLRWMTARGNDQDIETAKETIIAAIIGLVIVVGAYAITNFMTTRFIQGQSGPAGGINGAEEEDPNAPQGCCEFKVNEFPTWTAFVMTENACKASCINSLGKDNCGNDDYVWTVGLDEASCEERRENALR